jgi:ribonuclease BN (tRNA processing enzyme)
MSAVRVRFVGCGDAFAGGGRFQTCFHLEGGDEPILIDCGASSLIALKREGLDPDAIGYVALSHLHGDHFGGLPWLTLHGQYGGRTRPLVIAGPPGAEARFKEAFEALYPGSTSAERPFEIRFIELTERAPASLGPATVTPFEVVHQSGAPSNALRVDYGAKVLVYSGDTEWTDSLLDAARGADLFICECNFFDREGPGHLSYRTLAAKRPLLECQRLVLTHLSEEMLANLGDVELEAAQDGLVLTL